MKKRIFSLLLALAVLAAGAVSALASSNADKTVVTLSYLNGTYSSQLRQQFTSLLSPLDSAYAAAVKRLNDKTGTQSGNRSWTTSAAFVPLYPLAGESDTLSAGSGLLWQSGQGSASAALVDVTSGEELAAGQALTTGHRYLAEVDTIVIASSASACSAEGQWVSTATGTAPRVSPFKDVREGDWYYDAVLYAVDRGLFNGTSATTFEPNATMNRAMLVTVLHRMAGRPSASGSNPFTDVNAAEWYGPAVLWANQAGIVTGTSATTFDPNGTVTREQIAVMLYRYASYLGTDVSQRTSVSGFTDASRISDYAQDAVSWAAAVGLLRGDAGRLNPGSGATRAEVATILQRYNGG